MSLKIESEWNCSFEFWFQRYPSITDIRTAPFYKLKINNVFSVLKRTTHCLSGIQCFSFWHTCLDRFGGLYRKVNYNNYLLMVFPALAPLHESYKYWAVWSSLNYIINSLISQAFSPLVCVHTILLWLHFVCLSFLFFPGKNHVKRISGALPLPLLPLWFLFLQ